MALGPRLLLRLYPPAWRARYGAEFLALLEKEGTDARVAFNVALGALDAWMSPRRGAAHAVLDGPTGPGVLLLFPPGQRGWPRGYTFRVALMIALGSALWALTGVAIDRWGESVFLRVSQYASYWIAFCVISVPWDFREYRWRTRIAAVLWLLAVFYGMLVAIVLVVR